jgi:hypothetical protein
MTKLDQGSFGLIDRGAYENRWRVESSPTHIVGMSFGLRSGVGSSVVDDTAALLPIFGCSLPGVKTPSVSSSIGHRNGSVYALFSYRMQFLVLLNNKLSSRPLLREISPS